MQVNEGRLDQLNRDWRALANTISLSDELERQRPTVWAGSEFVAQQMMRYPESFAELVEQGLLLRSRDLDEIQTELESAISECEDEEQLAARLRRFRNREMVRIIWRDLADLAPLNETLAELSELADSCIRLGVQQLYQWAVQKDGVPRNPEGEAQHLVVLGMGKLGARELNLSSDIDLIFCFPEHGHTDGRRQVENETFFTRLGRRLINLLSPQTADGFVFRVDMRLRPFGDAGPLVVSFDAMEQYLLSQAREWERYAMVKARAITGEARERESLRRLIHAFVYRRYIDFGVIESIRRMKAMIEQELSRKGFEASVKLGMGGIREIEFIGQVFQLVRGGRDRDLQIRPIQTVLELLGDKGLMPKYAVRELLAAYAFLRRTENHIQAWRDQQTHLLPSDEAGQERLGRGMGFRDWDEFENVLNEHRQRVHSHFEQVFDSPQAETDGNDAALLPVWSGDGGGEDHIDQLESTGFKSAPEIVARLATFRESALLRTLSADARAKLDQLMPMALEAAASTTSPDDALLRLLTLLEGIVRRTAYLDLLVENPLALSQLVRLLGESVWIGTQLARMPILLDELLDPRRLYAPAGYAELTEELAVLMRSVEPDDLEQEMERVRQFALGNRLRVAAADIVGAIPLMVVSDRLTDIAEVTLQQVYRSAWRDLTARHGKPGLKPPMQEGFAVIGFGKLGGIELGYGSDLDIVFLHGSDDPNAVTDGNRQAANDVFYARLGQRMIHMLTTRMPSGILYEVDMRLRPNGKSGLLVSSLKAFERYQMEDAWTWEHQALVRARALSGDPAVAERFNAIRRDVLCQRRDPDGLRKDVLEMRTRMAENLDGSNAEVFDIKQGPGGLVDIEFLVQFGVLRWAHEYPGLTDWSDNARLLNRLGEYGLLDPNSAEQLFSAYRVFRAIVHRRALQEEKALMPQEELQEERAMVRDIWDRVFATEG